MACIGFAACAVASLGAALWLVATPGRRRRSERYKEAEAMPAPASTRDHDEQASAQMTGLIDLLFALVFTLPVVVSSDSFAHPFHSNVPFMLATVVALYVVIRSFVDWHIAMEDAPYRIRSSQRTVELARVYVDIAIVVAYVLLVMSTQPLVATGGADLTPYLAILVVVLALYMLWGALRLRTYKPHEFTTLTLAVAAFGLLAVLGGYRIGVDNGIFLPGHANTRNTVALLAAASVYAAYRKANWHEMRKFTT